LAIPIYRATCIAIKSDWSDSMLYANQDFGNITHTHGIGNFSYVLLKIRKKCKTEILNWLNESKQSLPQDGFFKHISTITLKKPSFSKILSFFIQRLYLGIFSVDWEKNIQQVYVFSIWKIFNCYGKTG
jgi:hypothetical protein